MSVHPSGTETALERLLARMNAGGDFPVLSSTIAELNQAVNDDNGHTSSLTEVILRDVSLTNKLLRLVNTAHYGFTGQAISTVSRAVVILGFDAVRDAAVSLLLFEHLDNHAQADELKAEAVERFFCATLGRMLAPQAGVRDAEEAFISALFRHIGRLMARFHFYPQTVRVARYVQDEGLTEAAAARLVLGVDYDQLGLAIARHWHFAPTILHAIAPLDPGPVKAAGSLPARLHVVANLADELYRMYAANLPAEQQRQALTALCARFREAVRVTPEDLAERVHKAAAQVWQQAHVMHADAARSALMGRLRGGDAAPPHAASAAPRAEAAEPARAADDRPEDILAAGLQEITGLMLTDYRLSDVLRLGAELLYRSGSFDHVLVSTLDRVSQSLVARIALGPGTAGLKAVFRIPLGFSPDVFHAALVKGQDVLIEDVTADNIRSRIPDWFVRHADADSFLLLPINLDGRPLAMFYAGRRGGALHLSSQVLGMVKALRNQIALAIRHKT